jgi:hypothetical protein
VAEWLARPSRQERSNYIHLTQRFGAKKDQTRSQSVDGATGSERKRFALPARAYGTEIFILLSNRWAGSPHIRRRPAAALHGMLNALR